MNFVGAVRNRMNIFHTVQTVIFLSLGIKGRLKEPALSKNMRLYRSPPYLLEGRRLAGYFFNWLGFWGLVCNVSVMAISNELGLWHSAMVRRARRVRS